jgi:hypothetical protein
MAKTGCWRSGSFPTAILLGKNAVGEAPARPNGTDTVCFTNSIAVRLLAKGRALRQQDYHAVGEGPSFPTAL